MKKKIQYNYILELLNELICLILDLIEISVSTAKPNLFLNDFDIKNNLLQGKSDYSSSENNNPFTLEHC
jgi:hypothetical protein